MNLYDFDETIYDGDSTRDFCIYLYLHYPRTLAYLPKQLGALIRYMLGKLDKTAFKECYFSMFAAISDIDQALEDFWNRNDHKVIDYYLPQARPDDVVISASPQFIVEPMCQRLGIQTVIGSKVDKHTGQFQGKNCYGAEKVTRFIEAGFDPADVEQVYSDSMSDTPMARMGTEAFIVTKEGLTGWVAPKQKGMQAFFTLFNKPEALITIGLGILLLLVVAGLSGSVMEIWQRSIGSSYGITMLSNGLVCVLVFWLIGKLNNEKCAVAAKALAKIVLPMAVVGALIAALLPVSDGWSVFWATLLNLPVLYKGTDLLFRKEIAQQQAKLRADMEEGQ